jgi:hypothetical protein
MARFILIVAALLGALPVSAQTPASAARGRYCYADLTDNASKFRAVINTYRTPEKILILEVKKRQAADTYVNESLSFSVGFDYATVGLVDEDVVRSARNYLLRNRKYTAGSDLADADVQLVNVIRKACPPR